MPQIRRVFVAVVHQPDNTFQVFAGGTDDELYHLLYEYVRRRMNEVPIDAQHHTPTLHTQLSVHVEHRRHRTLVNKWFIHACEWPVRMRETVEFTFRNVQFRSDPITTFVATFVTEAGNVSSAAYTDRNLAYTWIWNHIQRRLVNGDPLLTTAQTRELVDFAGRRASQGMERLVRSYFERVALNPANGRRQVVRHAVLEVPLDTTGASAPEPDMEALFNLRAVDPEDAPTPAAAVAASPVAPPVAPPENPTGPGQPVIVSPSPAAFVRQQGTGQLIPPVRPMEPDEPDDLALAGPLTFRAGAR